MRRASELHPTDSTLLACSTKLRKEFPADLARAAIEMTILRRKAQNKFTHATEMFFERGALEQSSSEIISQYRAERYGAYECVADWCCGIGGDTIGLAEKHRVIAVDVDPLRLAMAAHNVEACGLRERVQLHERDVLASSLDDEQAVFADPDRRSGGKRHLSHRYYQPRLDQLLSKLPSRFPLGVKMAPGIAWADLNDLDAEMEFISLDGELKECVAWFGPLRTQRRRATLLPSRATLIANDVARSPGVVEPVRYLYDPDSAVVRSGLVTNLAQQLGAKLIDEEIAYLTSIEHKATPLATSYRIEEVHPFHQKRLADRLRALKVGEVTITKRGSAIDPNKLHKNLKLKGNESRTIILTRTLGRPVMMIATKLNT